MSKDSFKVKKGLTLTPIDPADITNPQAGDLIADSTDDNKIKKYDADSSDWTSVGGSAGIGGNLMSDFEKLTPTESNVTSAVDTVTFLPIDDNNKSIKATFSGSVGSIQYQVALDSSLQEIQGTVSVWIRTSLNNIQISSVQDGVKISTLPVSGTDKWKQYEIPMVLGGSNVGFIVESLTGVTGDVFIDVPFVGLTPSSYAFEVAQTERFGKATWTGAANCEWRATVAVSATYYELAADSDCNDPVIEGSIQPPTTKKPAIVLPSGSPAGTYSFRWTGSPRNEANVTGICHFRFTDGTNNTASGRIYSGAGNDSETPNLFGSITYDSALTVDTEIKIEASANVSSLICTNYNDKTWSKQSFEVIYYPPKSSIVTQVQELDVNSANEYNVVFTWNGSAWVESTKDFNPIDNFSVNTPSAWTANFKSGLFTVVPAIDCTTQANQGSVTETTVFNISTTSFQMQGYNYSAGGQANSPVFCTIKKQGADYNKSAMIVGNFEQIDTTELAVVEAEGNGGESITGNVTPVVFNEVRDNKSAWDGSTFTVPSGQSGEYIISGKISVTASSTYYVWAYIDRGSGYVQEKSIADTSINGTSKTISAVLKLNEGDKLQLRTTTDVTLSNDARFHYITIKKSPDTASLIKNLNDSKSVKFQRKLLTTSSFSDVNFSNLTIGKKYKVVITLSKGSGTAAINLEGVHNGVTMVQNYLNSTDGRGGSAETKIFTATATTFTFSGSGVGSISTGEKSFVEIYEYPDYYIETDEW